MRYDVPIYDPYKDPGEGYFHPADDITSYLVFVRHIYSDIAYLGKILRGISDEYGKKLIAKYIVIECVSMDTYIQKLVKRILAGKVDYEVDEDMRRGLQELYRDYKEVKRKVLPSFMKIRNKIAAHRDPLALSTVSEIWDSLDVYDIQQFLKSIPPLFENLRMLRIYQWTKTEIDEDGHIITAYVQPLVFGKIE